MLGGYYGEDGRGQELRTGSATLPERQTERLVLTRYRREVSIIWCMEANTERRPIRLRDGSGC